MNHEYKKKYLKYKRKYLNLEISKIKGGNKQIGGSTYIIINGLLILITAVLTATIILGTIPNPETNMYITQLTDKDKVNKKLNERLKKIKLELRNKIEENDELKEEKLKPTVQKRKKLTVKEEMEECIKNPMIIQIKTQRDKLRMEKKESKREKKELKRENMVLYEGLQTEMTILDDDEP